MVQVFARTCYADTPKRAAVPSRFRLCSASISRLSSRQCWTKSSHVSSTFTCLVERSVISAGHFHRLKLFERTIVPGDVIVFHFESLSLFANWKILVSRLKLVYTFFPREKGGRKNRQKFARGVEIRKTDKRDSLFDPVCERDETAS